MFLAASAIYNEITGLLVPVKDSYALANAIEKLVSNKEWRRTMGNEGRIMAEEKFDENMWLPNTQKYMIYYLQINNFAKSMY